MLLCADLAGKKTSIDAAPAVRAMIIVSAAGRNYVRELVFHIFRLTFFRPAAETVITAAVCFSIRRLI
jgi:hypothetical protein